MNARSDCNLIEFTAKRLPTHTFRPSFRTFSKKNAQTSLFVTQRTAHLWILFSQTQVTTVLSPNNSVERPLAIKPSARNDLSEIWGAKFEMEVTTPSDIGIDAIAGLGSVGDRSGLTHARITQPTKGH